MIFIWRDTCHIHHNACVWHNWRFYADGHQISRDISRQYCEPSRQTLWLGAPRFSERNDTHSGFAFCYPSLGPILSLDGIVFRGLSMWWNLACTKSELLFRKCVSLVGVMFVTVCWQKTPSIILTFRSIGISFWIQPLNINDKAVVIDVSLLKRQPLEFVFV